MNKNILVKAAILGATAIALGALGAHALKSMLTADQLTSFTTGVRFQIYHSIYLIGLFVLMNKFPDKAFKISGILIFWGVILFSGSIYLLTIKNITDVAFLRFAGPITPIGGVLMIAGWIYLLIGALRIKS